MKIITLWEPWATLVSLGYKQYETRDWSTKYRGRLAIHTHSSRKVVDSELKEIAENSGGKLEYSFLRSIDYQYGKIITVCEIEDCAQMINEYLPGRLDSTILVDSVSTLERAVGIWDSGRFAFHLQNNQPLEAPIPYKGGQKLRNVDESTTGQIEQMLRQIV